MRNKNLVKGLMVMVGSVILVVMVACGNPFSSSSSSDDPEINRIARDLADYNEGEGPLVTDDEQVAGSFVTEVPLMILGVSAGEDGWEAMFKDLRDELGNEWAKKGDWEYGWKEGWWENDAYHSDQWLVFDYSYSDSEISFTFELDRLIDISADHPGGIAFDDDGDDKLTEGTIRLQIEVEYNGTYVSEEEDTGSGTIWARLDMDGLRVEGKDGDGAIFHEAFMELDVAVDGSLFYDDGDIVAIKGDLEGSLVSANSLNLDFRQHGHEDQYASGKYVAQMDASLSQGKIEFINGEEENGNGEENGEDNGDENGFFDEIIEALDFRARLDVCKNSGEVVKRHTFSLEDIFED